MRQRHARFAALLAAIGILASVLVGASAATAAPAARVSGVSATASCQSSTTVGCIQGTLRDDNGNGVAGVKVTLTGSSGASATATTDATGTYVFAVTANGAYKLSLDASTLPAGVTAAAATTRTITATLGQLQPAVFALDGHAQGSTASASPGAFPLWRQIWDQFSQGLLLGLLLALASIGLSLIYGTTGLSNFAHAEQMTLGGMLAYVFGIQLGLPFILSTLIVIVLCAASGYLQDLFIWAPLRRRGVGLTQAMVVTIGLSLALDYVYQYFWGSQVVPVSATIERLTGPLDLTPSAYWSMLVSVIVLLGVGFALTRTRIGRATRAVSDNQALAAASGIDVNRIIRLVWIVSTALAGLSGVLYALVNGGIQWSTGVQLLLLIFSAVTLGGIGTAFGALVGSLIIGIIVQMSSLVLSADLKYATALFLMILILLFRPQGILGRRERVG